MPISTSKHAVVATPAGGARFRAAVRGHALHTDQPEKLGGTDTAPTPLELRELEVAPSIAAPA